MKPLNVNTLNVNTKQKETLANLNGHLSLNKKVNLDPWAIDRVGRLIVGFIILGSALATIFSNKLWAIILIASGLNLIVTSITNKCLFNKILRTFGFKEREAIYESDGRIKNISSGSEYNHLK